MARFTATIAKNGVRVSPIPRRAWVAASITPTAGHIQHKVVKYAMACPPAASPRPNTPTMLPNSTRMTMAETIPHSRPTRSPCPNPFEAISWSLAPAARDTRAITPVPTAPCMIIMSHAT